MKLNDTLKKRRLELGLTLNEVAQKVGVTEATVQRWESGRIKTIGSDKIKKLASTLHVSIHSLVDLDNVKKKADAMDSLLIVLKDVYDDVLIHDYEDTGSYDVILVKGNERITLKEVPYQNLFNVICNNVPYYVKQIISGNSLPKISWVNENNEYVESFTQSELFEIISDLENMPDEALEEFKAIAKYIKAKYETR